MSIHGLDVLNYTYLILLEENDCIYEKKVKAIAVVVQWLSQNTQGLNCVPLIVVCLAEDDTEIMGAQLPFAAGVTSLIFRKKSIWALAYTQCKCRQSQNIQV